MIFPIFTALEQMDIRKLYTQSTGATDQADLSDFFGMKMGWDYIIFISLWVIGSPPNIVLHHWCHKSDRSDSSKFISTHGNAGGLEGVLHPTGIKLGHGFSSRKRGHCCELRCHCFLFGCGDGGEGGVPGIWLWAVSNRAASLRLPFRRRPQESVPGDALERTEHTSVFGDSSASMWPSCLAMSRLGSGVPSGLLLLKRAWIRLFCSCLRNSWASKTLSWCVLATLQ